MVNLEAPSHPVFAGPIAGCGGHRGAKARRCCRPIRGSGDCKKGKRGGRNEGEGVIRSRQDRGMVVLPSCLHNFGIHLTRLFPGWPPGNSLNYRDRPTLAILQQADSKVAACNDKKAAVNTICVCGEVCSPWGPCVCTNPVYHVCNDAKKAASAVLGAFCSAADAAQNAFGRAQSLFDTVSESLDDAVSKAKTAAQALAKHASLDDLAKKAAKDARDLLDTSLSKGDALLDKFVDRVRDLLAATKDNVAPIKATLTRFASQGGSDVMARADFLQDLGVKLKTAIGMCIQQRDSCACLQP